jgi:hypothetical protein
MLDFSTLLSLYHKYYKTAMISPSKVENTLILLLLFCTEYAINFNMTEHLGGHEYEKEQEITREEKIALISRARTLAPYRGQPIDQFGSFVTHFYHADDEGFTSIYIPGLSGHTEPGRLFSDSVQVMDRRLEEEIEGISLVRIRSYIVHETTLILEYVNELRAFDTQTGKPIQEDFRQDPERLVEAQLLEYPDRIAAFTRQRLIELHQHLDTLDSEDTFEFPNASNT